MKKIKIGLLFFDPFSINKGTAALAYSIIYLLNNISKKYNVNFDYICLEPCSPRQDLDDKVITLNQEQTTVTLKQSFPSNTLKQVILKYLRYKKYLESLDIDFALDIGEGDSYSDIYGNARFNKLNAVKRLYIRKKIPLALLPQTIGPFSNIYNKKMATKTLKKCTSLMVRDKQSLQCINDLVGKKNIFSAPDIAFFMPFHRIHFDSSKIHVGLNISGLLWNGGYTKKNQFNLLTDYKVFITRIIDYFEDEPNVVLHLVPHVIHEYPSIDNDYFISYDIFSQKKSNKMLLAPFFKTPVDAKSYIAGMDFFVGARMHSTIAAFSSEVPVCPVAYSRKFTGLYEDSLNYYHIANLMKYNTEESINTVVSAYQQRHSLKQEELLIMKEILTKRELLENNIAEFLKLKEIVND